MGGFWALISAIWCNIGKILNNGSTLANKNIVSNFFEGFFYLWKRDGPKVSTFAPTLTLLFLLKMAEIGSNKQHCSKTLAIELSKYVKMKPLSHLPFLGKYDSVLQYLEYFYRETGRNHKSKEENQNLTNIVLSTRFLFKFL